MSPARSAAFLPANTSQLCLAAPSWSPLPPNRAAVCGTGAGVALRLCLGLCLCVSVCVFGSVYASVCLWHESNSPLLPLLPC
jgi:hypothetical protein